MALMVFWRIGIMGDEVRVEDIVDWEDFSRINIVTIFMRIELLQCI